MSNKNQFQNIKIIRCLSRKEVLSTSEIAKEVGLSEKTVRLRLKGIEELLKNANAGSIQRKPRVGTWLEASDEEMVRVMRLISSHHEPSSFEDSPKIRQHKIKREILKTYKSRKVHPTKLCQQFYVSPTTLHQDLEVVEKSFKKFDLNISTERNSGIGLVGEEFSYRLALKEYMFENELQGIDENLLDFTGYIDTQLIRKTITRAEDDWGIKFDEVSFNQTLVNIAITIIRVKYSKDLNFLETETRRIEKYIEYSFACSILDKITAKTGIEFTDKDRLHVAINILCSRFINDIPAEQAYTIVTEHDNDLHDFVKKAIKIVSDVLEIDFSDDPILFEGLVQHIRPMIFRLRYGISHSNQLIDFVKEEYKLIYRATWLISVLFEEHYDLSITEHELSYLAIYFEAALQRKKKSLDIIFITKRQISYTRLLKEKISRSINNDKSIEIINYHDFDIENYPRTDIILTTDPLYTDDKRVVLVNDMMIEESIDKVNEKIEKIRNQKPIEKGRFNPICHQLFDPELCIVNLKAGSREEVISKICKKLKKRNFVNEKYEKTVVNHEYLAVTEIGNGIVIPHGSQHEVNESKVAIAILDEPIVWHEEKVDVVFLLAVKMTNENEIKKTKLFYKDYINIIDTDEKINILREMKSNLDLYNYLIG